MVQLKEFTIEEVQKTKGTGKVVIILHDKVYDVTEFLNEHPGGEEILIDHAGKDGTENFNDVGHSQDALDLMNKYKIGELIESQRTNKPLKKGWVAGYNNKQPENEKYVKGPGAPFYTLIAAIMLLAAIIFYNMS
ncbi:cytochrome b5-like [Vespa crabro]|uniref:cytochrome b5-like n=1 Tax=Vespa crabro TaxID=7445 RepID=UPI001F01571A|nr:cytochrome b5-like [Vespa crabro]XP_046822284.1 cytochrome b5-like [Vespa crabro]